MIYSMLTREVNLLKSQALMLISLRSVPNFSFILKVSSSMRSFMIFSFREFAGLDSDVSIVLS